MVTPVLAPMVAPVLAAAAAALLLTRPGGRVGPVARGRETRAAASGRGIRRWWPLAPASVATVVVSGLQGRHLALCAVLVAVGAGVLAAAHRNREEASAHARRVRAIDLCEALAGELRAGQPTLQALERATAGWPEAQGAAVAARLGASVPDALRELAMLRGAASLRRLAAAWQVSGGTGAGLVIAVEQVLETARAEERAARLVRAELASARATARLVTALPVVVLLGAQGVGARPWHFLLATDAGIGCLAAGAGLALAGLGWIDRIARRSAEGSG